PCIMRSWTRCVNGRMRPSGRRRISTSVCIGKPSLVAMAPASINTTINACTAALITTFAPMPVPTGPRCMMASAMPSKTGWALASVRGLAPTKESVFPRRHTGHTTGNGGIDEVHMVRLANSIEFLRHLWGNSAGLDDQVRDFGFLHQLCHYRLGNLRFGQ